MALTPVVPVFPAFSVREKQLEAVRKMLNFNMPLDESGHWKDQWKILIYDAECRDIIAPILKVGELKELGVTLHMLINSERYPIPDVPAIYFVTPTKENVQRIAQDCGERLYDAFHLNFVKSLPRPLLEYLVTQTLENDATSLIAKVYDQYLHFISLESDLFITHMPNSYVTFNDQRVTDSQAHSAIDAIVDSLFSVLITLEVIPVIRCPRGSAAEHVAQKLDERLRQFLLAQGDGDGALAQLANAASGVPGGDMGRPVLILLDRNVDLAVMLHHPWTYQTLVHDLLDMDMNRVRVKVAEVDTATGQSRTVDHTYDLDAATDAFWAAQAAAAFPDMSTAAHQLVVNYQQAYEEVKRLGGGGIDVDKAVAGNPDADLLAKTKELSAVALELPALTEKKRLADIHVNVAKALLAQIKQRKLDELFATEETLLMSPPKAGTSAAAEFLKKEVMPLLAPEHPATVEDKLRVFLIYLLSPTSGDDPASPEIEALERQLRAAGADMAPVEYVKQLKSFHRSLKAASHSGTSSSGGGVGGMLGSVIGAGVGSALHKGYHSMSNMLAAGVEKFKSLLPTAKPLIVTQIVEALMEGTSGGSGGGGGGSGGRSPAVAAAVENYIYLDPKAPQLRSTAAPPRRSAPFREAIVFTIGGGSYVEYQNLLGLTKGDGSAGTSAMGAAAASAASRMAMPTSNGRRIIYGSTEMLSPAKFLQQLSTLGKVGSTTVPR